MRCVGRVEWPDVAEVERRRQGDERVMEERKQDMGGVGGKEQFELARLSRTNMCPQRKGGEEEERKGGRKKVTLSMQ